MSEKEIWEMYEEKIKKLWDIVEDNPKFKGKLKGAVTANLVAELIKTIWEKTAAIKYPAIKYPAIMYLLRDTQPNSIC